MLDLTLLGLITTFIAKRDIFQSKLVLRPNSAQGQYYIYFEIVYCYFCDINKIREITFIESVIFRVGIATSDKTNATV